MTHAVPDFDVVIVGGGMVGSMLACALGHSQFRVAVLEAEAPQPYPSASATPFAIPFNRETPYDLRVSALSMGSERMLVAVGAWKNIVERRACAYTHMHVWDSERAGATHFYSGDIGQTHLGHIVENRVLKLALTERMAVFGNVDYFCPARLASLSIDNQRVKLILADGQELATRLLVGADGATSKVRELAGITANTQAYPQHALVATIRTKLTQQCATWQRFTPQGPQAFLPLCGSNASMVWYNTEQEVARLKALDAHRFIAEMEAAYPTQLGGIEALIERGSFPLYRSHARQYVKPRVALIGDAAHTVHPLAGQGVNLGLLDAAVLAEVVIRAERKSLDCGKLGCLRRYERWRRFENGLMINALDGFYHAFKAQPVPLQHLRSAAMNVADRVSPLKSCVTAYAMGIAGDLPQLAKGRLP